MLVVLEVVAGAEVGRQIKIRQDQTCKIGRTNWADAVFSDDVMMSGQHFEIQNDGKYCWLRDLESRNGTRVDDDFVKENLILNDGQSVQAGRTQFVVRIDGGAKSPYESTSCGNFEPVKNPALMSMQFGGPPVPEGGADPRFASSATPNVPPKAEAPSDSPELPIPGPILDNIGADIGGNIELPPHDTPEFPGSKAGAPASGPARLPGEKSPPPWTPPGSPSQPIVGQVNMPPPGSPPSAIGNVGGPIGRGGDGPVFKFAKVPLPPGPAVPGGPGSPPVGPISGSPGALYSPGASGFPAESGPQGDPADAGPPQFAEPPSQGSPPPSFPVSKLPPIAPGAPATFPGLGGFGGGVNPNLDLGPEPDFGEVAADSPKFNSPNFAGSSGPVFRKPPGPGGINPNLIGTSDDETTDLPTLGTSAKDAGGLNTPTNWRNPDYVASGSTAARAEEVPEDVARDEVTPSVHGICFREETTAAGYPVYRSIFAGVPQVSFSPFGLVSAVSRIAQPVLAIHFLRAERPIPEGLEGIPLRGDLDPKFAPLGGPMLYAPKDLRPFREIIDELWGSDAISCLFTSGDAHAIIDHFRQGLFGPRRGDLPSAGPGPQFFAVFSPNLLTTFLASRDQGTVDQLLGSAIDGVLTEIADMPDSWQFYTRKPWTQQLKQLGMNRVVSQPQTI